MCLEFSEQGRENGRDEVRKAMGQMRQGTVALEKTLTCALRWSHGGFEVEGQDLT